MYRPSVSVGVLALVLLVAGCGSASDSGEGGEPPKTPTTSAPPSTPPPSTASSSTAPPPTASPSTAQPSTAPPSPPPTAADGTRYSACGDGTCEVRVTTDANVPVPDRFGLGPIMVSSIKDGTVILFAPLTQSEFSSDGGCHATFTGPGADSSAYALLTCDSGAKAAVNQMGLQVVDVSDGAAIIRIRPAT